MITRSMSAAFTARRLRTGPNRCTPTTRRVSTAISECPKATSSPKRTPRAAMAANASGNTIVTSPSVGAPPPSRCTSGAHHILRVMAATSAMAPRHTAAMPSPTGRWCGTRRGGST